MNVVVFDVETTIFAKGNPFANRNRLCYFGAKYHGGVRTWRYFDGVLDEEFLDMLVGSDMCVGFNLKFDLHWLWRVGVDLNKRMWDCQFAHYLLTHQRTPWWDNSLNGVAAHYGIPGKIDVVEKEYWSKGIDTPDIPEDLMHAYLAQDLECTWAVFHKQWEEINKDRRLANLMRLHMDDLLVLCDMERNGLVFNEQLCKQKEQESRAALEAIEKDLGSRCPNVPINWDSGDHVSAYLYGGTISVERQEPAGVYKTGKKIGGIRYRWVTDTYTLPQLVEPIKGSELKKADKEKGTGPWSTADDILAQLKQIKEVKLLRERSKLSKLLDYFTGFPALRVQRDWNEGKIHGQFNQNRTRTGRLSSSDPNLQNMPEPVLQLIETRYVGKH